MPAVQLSQEGAPGTDATVPASHGAQGTAPPGECVPGGHTSQSVWLLAVENWPPGQVTHVGLPVPFANVPTGQAKHASAPAVLDDPAGHGLQSLAAMAVENRPAGQTSQLSAPPIAYRPAVHAAHAAKPTEALLYRPGPQGKHDAALAAGAYVPGSQMVHALARSPLYCPAAQSAQGVDRPGEYCPAAQSVHCARPGWALNCPAGHGWQFAHPTSLYAPLAQSWHAPQPSGLHFPAPQ